MTCQRDAEVAEVLAGARMALSAMRLEAPAPVVDDLTKRVEAAFTLLAEREAHAAADALDEAAAYMDRGWAQSITRGDGAKWLRGRARRIREGGDA